MKTMEIIFAVAGAVLMGFVFVFKKYYDKFNEMSKKTDTKADDIVLYIANLCVPLIERTFSNDTGDYKKAQAINLVNNELAKVGITATSEVVSNAIETAVTTMKVNKSASTTEESEAEKK